MALRDDRPKRDAEEGTTRHSRNGNENSNQAEPELQSGHFLTLTPRPRNSNRNQGADRRNDEADRRNDAPGRFLGEPSDEFLYGATLSEDTSMDWSIGFLRIFAELAVPPMARAMY